MKHTCKLVPVVLGLVSLTLAGSAAAATALSQEGDTPICISVSLDKGTVMKIDTDAQKLTVKVSDKEHTVSASSVTLLNAEGKAAKLSEFYVAQAVEVTFKDGSITTIQMSK